MTAIEQAPLPATSDDAEPFSGHWVRRLLFFASLGLLQLLVNFPKFLTTTIDANVPPGLWRTLLHAPVGAVKAVVTAIIGTDQTGFFERAMTCAFLMLWVLLASLLLQAARRDGLKLLFYCLLGLALGYVAVHVLSWLALAVVMTVGGVLFVFKWIGALAYAIFRFLTHPIVLTLLAAGGVILLRKSIWSLVADLFRWIGRHLIPAAITVAATALLIAVFPAILRVFEAILKALAPIFAFLWAVLGFIIFAVAIIIASVAAIAVGLLSLALLGSLLVSQLQAAWHSARSVRRMLTGGFAIGGALSVVALTSIATPEVAGALNGALFGPFEWLVGSQPHALVTDLFRATLPREVLLFVTEHLDHLQAPAVDGLIFLAVTVLAATSALVRLFSNADLPAEDVKVTYVVQEYAIMAFGLFIAILVIFMQAESGDSSA